MASTAVDNGKKSATAVDGTAVDESNVERNFDVGIGSQTDAVDYSYLRSWSFGSFYRGVLFQMILFGA